VHVIVTVPHSKLSGTGVHDKLVAHFLNHYPFTSIILFNILALRPHLPSTSDHCNILSGSKIEQFTLNTKAQFVSAGLKRIAWGTCEALNDHGQKEGRQKSHLRACKA
jgi:hypothetical protein